MRAIVVREFGGPEVMRARRGRRADAWRVGSARARPCRRREPGGRLHPQPARTRGSRTCPTRPAPTAPARSRRSARDVKEFKPGDRVYIAGDNAVAPLGPGTYAEQALCRPTQLHRAARARDLRARARRSACPYATAYRALFIRAARQARRDGARARRDWRRRHRRRRARARARHDGDRHRRDRPRARGRARAWRATSSSTTRTPNYLDAVMQATGGRGVDVVLEMAAHINLDKDLARPRAQRPHRRHRQPRTCRDRSARRRWARTRPSSA